MSNDNESINGFNKPVTNRHVTEISIFELSYIRDLLKQLDESDISDELNLANLKVCKIYNGLLNRLNKRNGIHTETEREINRLNKIIDDTLDDLEAIYKETGLDSVGVLIGNVRGSR